MEEKTMLKMLKINRKAKSLLAVLLAVALVFAVGGQAAWADAEDIPEFVIGDYVGSYSQVFHNTLTEYNGPGGSVIIPDGVEHIALSAFEGNAAVTDITIPASIKEMPIPYRGSFCYSQPFIDCPNLKSISVKPGSENFYTIDGVLFSRRFGYNNASYFQKPEGGISYSEEIFLYCYPSGKSDTAYSIPEPISDGNVKYSYSIGVDAFYGAKNLTSIRFPASLESIFGGVRPSFRGCTSLQSFEVDGKNEEYASIDGVLYIKSTTDNTPTYLLARYPPGRGDKAYAVVQKCDSVGGRAFADNAALENVILPDGLEWVSDYAFQNCTALTDVMFKGGQKYGLQINEFAFSGCYSLTSVTFDEKVLFRDEYPWGHPEVSQYMFSESDNLTIYGKLGTVAETYAKENNIPFVAGVVPPRVAKFTSSAILVNGKPVVFDAYNIKDNNYFKLRDLAFALSGSNKQFEVVWDGANNAIELTSGKAYTVVGGEMIGKGSGEKTPTPTWSKIYLDWQAVKFTAYNIDGNNYFKLRDVAAAFDFGVSWNGEDNTISIDTAKSYVPE
jgi:hypothetical protein